MQIVDPETEETVGPNEEGEFRVKYEGVMNAYYRNPKAYADTFDSQGYLKTGDIVYYTEDYKFFYITRIKDIFKFRGFHVSIFTCTINAEIVWKHNINCNSFRSLPC